jgi:hypothetical protein
MALRRTKFCQIVTYSLLQQEFGEMLFNETSFDEMTLNQIQPTHCIGGRKSAVGFCFTFISLARKNLAKNKPGNPY